MTDRRREERGSSIVEFSVIGVLGFGLLVQVIVLFGVLHRATLATSAAAREVGRAVVLADSDDVAMRHASVVVEEVARDHGLPSGSLQPHVEGRVAAIRSDLFAGVTGRQYDLLVSNPPYVTEDEYAALPGEYAHEPKLGLTSGADGLDLCLRMLDEAAEYLTEDGLLIVEVGESEHALAALLPEVPFIWIEFKVGQMGVFALERRDLVEHAAAIKAAAAARRPG